MFCSFDNLVLQVDTDVHEVIAVASDPDDQVPVFFRMLLCFTKSVSSDNIELDMMAVQPEIGSYEMGELVDSLFIR